MERLDKRFGVIAIEKRFINLEQLLEALKVQKTEELEQDKHRLIGAILVEKGFMNISQVDEVLKAIGIPVPRTGT